jgi:hypothetical protein
MKWQVPPHPEAGTEASMRNAASWLLKTASPWLMCLLKGALTVAGVQAIYQHLRAVYMLEPARSEHAPKWILLYVWMNVLDEIKAIILKRHITDHVHHIATGIGFTIDYFYGSHRTQVLCQMGYIGEAVAPFYQARSPSLTARTPKA